VDGSLADGTGKRTSGTTEQRALGYPWGPRVPVYGDGQPTGDGLTGRPRPVSLPSDSVRSRPPCPSDRCARRSVGTSSRPRRGTDERRPRPHFDLRCSGGARPRTGRSPSRSSSAPIGTRATGRPQADARRGGGVSGDRRRRLAARRRRADAGGVGDPVCRSRSDFRDVGFTVSEWRGVRYRTLRRSLSEKTTRVRTPTRKRSRARAGLHVAEVAQALHQSSVPARPALVGRSRSPGATRAPRSFSPVLTSLPSERNPAKYWRYRHRSSCATPRGGRRRPAGRTLHPGTPRLCRGRRSSRTPHTSARRTAGWVEYGRAAGTGRSTRREERLCRHALSRSSPAINTGDDAVDVVLFEGVVERDGLQQVIPDVGVEQEGKVSSLHSRGCRGCGAVSARSAPRPMSSPGSRPCSSTYAPTSVMGVHEVDVPLVTSAARRSVMSPKRWKWS